MQKRAIKAVYAQQVYTSRNVLGIEAMVETEGGVCAKAVCNAGVSVGTHEIAFQYDGGERWGGKGVTNAAASVDHYVNDALRGMDVTQQYEIDQKLRALNESRETYVGGNAMAAVSAAVLKAGAATLEIPLYRYIGGESARTLPVPGVPAFWGDSRWGGGVNTPGGKPTVAFQCYGFDSFAEASYAGWNIYQKWCELLRRYDVVEQNFDWHTIPQGKFRESDKEIYALMTDLIQRMGYEGRIGIQIDCASDSYYDRRTQRYSGIFSRGEKDRDQMIEFYKEIVSEFPVVSLEDPLYEDDYEGHALLTAQLDIQVVGDDLFTTNKERLKVGSACHAANAVLLKVNQVGTISDALETAEYAYQLGYGVMPCESRGEGAAIADYCVGINAGCVREMAICTDAANRFLEIERELGSKASFWGRKGLKGRRFQGN